MDCFYGNGFDELVVPTDGVLSDRLPSPESWTGWGIGGPENFELDHKSGAYDWKFDAVEDDFDSKSVCEDLDMTGEFSDDAFWKARASIDGPNYQIDNMAGSGRIDEMSSLNGDFWGAENLSQSFCYSPTQQRTNCNNYEKDMNSKLQNASSDATGLGSSSYLTATALSPALGSENECSQDSEFAQHNLEYEDSPSVMDSSGETSLEADVLMELKMIMGQFTDKSRICFRDSLYRLAKNSGQHCLVQNPGGDLFMDFPPATLDSETKRYGTRKGTESETNTIDRTIANLMFNKMESNAQDRPSNVTAPSHSKSRTRSRQTLPNDAEVPMFLFPTDNKSLVVEFGSVA